MKFIKIILCFTLLFGLACLNYRNQTAREESKVSPSNPKPQFVASESSAQENSTALTNFATTTDHSARNDSASLPTSNSFTELDPEKLAETVNSLTELEVRQSLAELSSDRLTGNYGHLLLRRWVELNPNAAADWALQNPVASVRSDLVDSVAVAWSQKDISAALTWTESIPDSSAKFHSMTDVGYELARSDSTLAMKLASDLPPSDESDTLLLYSLSQYSSVNSAESRDLALSLPDSPLRNEAIASVATISADTDGAQAAQFVNQNLSPGPLKDRALTGVIQVWGQSNPQQAAPWILSLSDSGLQLQTLQYLEMFSH